MLAIEEIEKELEEYGLTMEDIEAAAGEETPKWLQNWQAGKRLSTFEQSMKQQFLSGKQKEKERENENNINTATTSHIENTSPNTSKEEKKSSSEKDKQSSSPTDTTNKEENSSPTATNNSVDIEDEADPEPNLDPLEELFQEHPRKDDTHTYRGFYLENAVVKIIDKKSKKGGKGMKSKIVNEALKIVFKEKGWMD